jgi:hypothetical protein
MANEVLWLVNTVSSILTDEMDALAAGSGTSGDLGPEIDNSVTLLDRYASFDLFVDFVSAPTAGGVISLYFSQAMDGTNYTTTVDDRFAIHACDFIVANTTVAQVIPGRVFFGPTQRMGVIPPFKLKPYIVNGSDQAFPATGSLVKMRTFNEELQ